MPGVLRYPVTETRTKGRQSLLRVIYPATDPDPPFGVDEIYSEPMRPRHGAKRTSGSNALIERLGAITLEVTDLERAISFYRDGLRFTFDGYLGENPPQAQLRAGGARLLLVQAQSGRALDRTSGVFLALEVSGLDAYHDALVARGLTPSPPADANDHVRRFGISDPDGYRWILEQSLA